MVHPKDACVSLSGQCVDRERLALLDIWLASKRQIKDGSRHRMYCRTSACHQKGVDTTGCQEGIGTCARSVGS